MAYGAYEHYKPSGIKIIGSIPKHWTVRRLKFMARIQNGKDYKEVVSDDGFPVIGSGGEFAKANNYLYNGESVLLGRKGTIDRPLYINGPFWTVDTMFYTEVANDVSAKYLYYCALTINFLKYATSTALPSMTQQDLGAIPFAVPRHDEQRAIARFLDFKTAQIDSLIAKKKALLDKLAEKRTALISHAITKGLDSSVAMKDSGVAWLGDIPMHWNTLPLRRLIKTVKTGTTPSGVSEFHFDNDGIAWFRPGDFTDQIFIHAAEKRLSEEGVAEVRVFPAFTVMHVGIGATIGKVGIITEQGSCNQQINAIVCNEKLHNIFAAYFLQAIKEYIVKCGKYTTLPIINQDETKSLLFTAPPVDEQIKISDHLLREEKLIEQQKKKISEVIVRLQEYRSALITYAVTGKIDVRGFEIPQSAEGLAS
jgi:type I restriction enzyme, S subunit